MTDGRSRVPRRPRAQHLDFLASFGFTPHDWQRIKELAEQVTNNYAPAALDDLSVPVRVAAARKEDASRYNGRILGTHAGRALLYWRMKNRERETWAGRRRPP
jgi:hypothetical protein